MGLTLDIEFYSSVSIKPIRLPIATLCWPSNCEPGFTHHHFLGYTNNASLFCV